MTQKEVGKLYYGFKLLEIRRLNDINSTGFLFKHEKSGARLLYISNEDDNKVFSISFRTPPNSDNGIAHILEHSVLCGSKKYEAKEPFVELLKGSLNTYLNAMTFPDKTMYPVASYNDKDFMNLIDVYMDAVLYPKIYERQEILLQEGWHYEIDNADAPLSYGGVVYNEMKGAYSSADKILDNTIKSSLFPDNQYKYDSGGNPDSIPKLTYEEFLAFHKKYYHPSNSYIYFYGDGDIDKHLQYLDNNYLSKFDKIDINSSIEIQKPLDKRVEVNEIYPIGDEEDSNDKTYLALNFVASNSTDAQTVLGLDILSYVLLQTPASPLRKALLDASIGKSIYGRVNSYLRQPVFSIVAENTNVSDKEKFKKVINSTLNDIVKNGFDKKLIEGGINIFEFLMREADHGSRPKGLIYNLQALSRWLYDSDPMAYMQYNQYFENIRAKENYFEELIQECLLNNLHSSIVVISPEKGLETKNELELKNKLEDYKKTLSKDEINQLINTKNRLNKYQQTYDTKETLEQIPLLKLEDIDKKAKTIDVKVIEQKDYKLLMHTTNTNKIVYLNLMFDSTTVPQEILPYISILSTVLGKISTKNYNYNQLSNEISIYTGGISFNAEVFNKENDGYYPKFTISTKSLIDKLPKLLEILEEIINNTLFEDSKKIIEIIKEEKTDTLSYLLNRGNATAVKRAASSILQSSLYEDNISNISYYEFLSDLEKNIENNIDDIKQKLMEVASLIFNKQNLIVGVAIDKNNKDLFLEQFKSFENKLKSQKEQTYNYKFEKKYNKEAFLTSSKIQYVAKAVDYKKEGYKFDGSLKVLETILDLDYLWNKVRVQGGAYGVSIIIKHGYLMLTSYRDPNITKTLDVYDKIGEYTFNFEADEREMRKYIIGTISSLDRPMGMASKLKIAMIRYITSVSDEQRQKEREEILSTTCKKIKSYSDMLNKIMKQNNICVIGNENALKANKDLFDDLNTVFQN